MWHMICANGMKVTYGSIQTSETEGSAHWECDHLFHENEGSGARSITLLTQPSHSRMDSFATMRIVATTRNGSAGLGIEGILGGRATVYASGHSQQGSGQN